MCSRVVWSEGECISTQEELADRAGLLFMEDHATPRARDEEGCLCPVDIPRTLEHAGLEYQYDPGFDEYRISGDCAPG